MYDDIESSEIYNAQFLHPFRCTLCGPSQSGKSTWVHNFLKRQDDLIDVNFDIITIILGTEASKNKILSDLQSELPTGQVEIVELKKLYPTKESLESRFTPQFKNLMRERKSKDLKQCIVFDDLMSELAESQILVDIFTKYSSHYDISSIHITQNLFFKGGGKHGTDNVTVYRNTNILVLFNNPMDNSTVEIIAKRLSRGGNFKNLVAMIYYVLDRFRYLVIVGDQRVSPKLMFRTDIFALKPVPHQTIFTVGG